MLAAVVVVVVDAVLEKVTALGVRCLDRVMAAEDRLPLLGVTVIQSESSAGGMLVSMGGDAVEDSVLENN